MIQPENKSTPSPRLNYPFAIVVFIAAVLGAVYAKHGVVSTAIMSGGVVLTIFVFMGDVLMEIARRKADGEISVSPKSGISVKWIVKNVEPIDLFLPLHPTDSTEDRQAKQLCDEGRRVQEVGGDLDKAYDLFSRASAKDSNYWEPCVNMVNILVLKGDLLPAFTLATEYRSRFSRHPEAFAKLSLAMAQAKESALDANASAEEKRETYLQMAAIYEEAVDRCETHLNARIYLGKALLAAGEPKSRMQEYLTSSFKYPGFKQKFSDAIKGTEVYEALKRDFPDYF